MSTVDIPLNTEAEESVLYSQDGGLHRKADDLLNQQYYD